MNITCSHLEHLEQKSPTPGLQTCTRPQSVRNQATQQKVSGGQASHLSIHLLLPVTHIAACTIPLSMVKLSFTKLVPGAKKVEDC